MVKVAVGILQRDGTVLVCQRKRNARYGLKWEFPGGRLEREETIEQCLRRELKEELSITIQSIQKVETQTADYADGGTFEVSYCLVTAFDGNVRNNVFEQIRWVTPDVLRTLDILEGNRDFVGKLRLQTLA